jgi:cysteine sulfinate desulfinase/cysteine desulfurase-like protein
MNKDAVYLDYNATTPIRPEVITLMTEIMGTVGNASSVSRAVMLKTLVTRLALSPAATQHK